MPLGASLRYFGDGFQASKVIAGQRFWRIPVMEGEFLVAESVGVGRGVGGGNLVDRRPATRTRALDGRAGGGRGDARRGDRAAVPGRDRPQRQQGRRAARRSRCRPPPTISWRRRCAPRSTTRWSPTGVGAMFEIVIDGVSEEAVREAMRRGLHAAAGAGATHVTAANFGGKLGEFHFPLSELRDPP